MKRTAAYQMLPVVAILLTATACGSNRPVFYPNAHLGRVGQIQANATVSHG